MDGVNGEPVLLPTVPLSTPVPVLKVIPDGKVPLVLQELVVHPLVVNVTLMTCPTVHGPKPTGVNEHPDTNWNAPASQFPTDGRELPAASVLSPVIPRLVRFVPKLWALDEDEANLQAEREPVEQFVILMTPGSVLLSLWASSP